MMVSDFLDWPGDGTAKRFQLMDGEARAMSPAGATHGIIQAKLAYLITPRLIETGSECRAVTDPAIVPHLGAGSQPLESIAQDLSRERALADLH